MIKKEDILSGKSKPTLKILGNGMSGTGKTYLLFTFPRVAYLGTEPNGLDTARSNQALLNNLVWADEYIPSVTEDIKDTFVRLDKGIEQAHKDQADGKIDTLGLDNITYLAQNRWLYINKYEIIRTKSGEVDLRSMYGTLSRWLYTFTLTRLLSFKGNVFVACHEQTEGEEAMENKTNKALTIAPAILGGFRDMAAGMFSASIFLEKKRLGPDKYEYWARCQEGNQRPAKNRYNLPEMIQNVSYKTILESIGKGTPALTNAANKVA